MGYTKHFAIIVSSSNNHALERAHEMANKTFKFKVPTDGGDPVSRIGGLVTDIIPFQVNGPGGTFFISSTGSNQGRAIFEAYTYAIEKYLKQIKQRNGVVKGQIEYVIIEYANEWRTESPALIARVTDTNC